MITPVGAGTCTFTATGVNLTSQTATTPTYTVSSSSGATAFTLTGPSTGVVGVASTNFTVTPNGTETGVFTPNAISGVTYTPTTLTWSGDASAKTFTANSTNPRACPSTAPSPTRSRRQPR